MMEKKEKAAGLAALREKCKGEFQTVLRVQTLLRRMGRPAPGDIAGMLVISAAEYADLEKILTLAERGIELEYVNAKF